MFLLFVFFICFEVFFWSFLSCLVNHHDIEGIISSLFANQIRSYWNDFYWKVMCVMISAVSVVCWPKFFLFTFWIRLLYSFMAHLLQIPCANVFSTLTLHNNVWWVHLVPVMFGLLVDWNLCPLFVDCQSHFFHFFLILSCPVELRMISLMSQLQQPVVKYCCTKSLACCQFWITIIIIFLWFSISGKQFSGCVFQQCWHYVRKFQCSACDIFYWFLWIAQHYLYDTQPQQQFYRFNCRRSWRWRGKKSWNVKTAGYLPNMESVPMVNGEGLMTPA